MNTEALLSVGVVDLVGSALSGADARLVGEETVGALASLGDWAEDGVDGTGDTVSAADEVVLRAGVADAVEDGVVGVADAFASDGVIDGVLAADIDAGLSLGAVDGSTGASRADASVVGEAGIAFA